MTAAIFVAMYKGRKARLVGPGVNQRLVGLTCTIEGMECDYEIEPDLIIPRVSIYLDKLPDGDIEKIMYKNKQYDNKRRYFQPNALHIIDNIPLPLPG